MHLPKQPTEDEAASLKRLSQLRDFEVVLAWIGRNADSYLETSCDPTSDSRSRQAQGGWMAMNGILKTAKAMSPG